MFAVLLPVASGAETETSKGAKSRRSEWERTIAGSARACLGPETVIAVFSWSMGDHEVVGVLLGAGSSRRLGRPKQTLPLGDTTVLGWTLRDAEESALDRVCVVLGGAADEARRSLRPGRASGRLQRRLRLRVRVVAAGRPRPRRRLRGDHDAARRHARRRRGDHRRACSRRGAPTRRGRRSPPTTTGSGTRSCSPPTRSRPCAPCTATRPCGSSSTTEPEDRVRRMHVREARPLDIDTVGRLRQPSCRANSAFSPLPYLAGSASNCRRQPALQKK